VARGLGATEKYINQLSPVLFSMHPNKWKGSRAPAVELPKQEEADTLLVKAEPISQADLDLASKASFGSLLFPTRTTSLIRTPTSVGSGASSSGVTKTGTSIGRSAVRSLARKLSAKSGTFLDRITQSSPDQTQPPRMSGRKILELNELNSSLGPNPFRETRSTIGKQSGTLPRVGTSGRFLRRSDFKVTGLSDKLVQTLRNQLEWSELASFSGVELELASQALLGKELDWTLTLKIPGRSFGAAMEAKKMLLLMNFEVVSTSDTYLDGSIVFQSLWKLKEDPVYLTLSQFGLLQTSTQESGTQG